MKQLSKLIFLIFTLVILITTISIPPSLQASGLKPGVKTSPPPTEISILGFFDPIFKYLDQGDSNTLDRGNENAEIDVSTIAKQTVASIGVNIYLEKWTGSEWVQIGSSTVSASNKMIMSGYAIFRITTGYYYRARTVHWVNHNGTYEQGERYTNTILAR
ncbi:DUF6147 family protein [Paenibacillus sp. UNC496MF]|uniref:DUF6147 family protein n=1 Tax=Paenibacillus sp. UNC496MF TaxID=1502753 RepID=UPI0011602479|nr:DUF6147 family protein [Paenibacillus sp. UNC496MF]